VIFLRIFIFMHTALRLIMGHRGIPFFYADIENFDVTFVRLPLNSNILEFFNDLQLKLPHISALAQVVLEVNPI